MQVSDAVVEAVSGAVGSVLALLATYPLKTIYTHQALSSGAGGGKESAALSVLDIVAKYRLSGLYVGIEPNIVESGISSGVYFYLYSRLRSLAVRSRQGRAAQGQQQQAGGSGAGGGSTKNQDIGVLASLLVAAVAGVGNQLVTLPASVVATRMQAKQKQRIESGNPNVRTGAGAVISDVWAEGGLAGFWSGLVPSLVLVANPAVQYMLYEQLLRLMRKWKQERVAAQRQQGSGAEEGSGAAAAGQSSAAPAPEVKLSSWEIFLASAIAKIGATVVTYPMVVIKSRVQAASKSSELQYTGTFHAITQTFQDEGVGGFFKGLRAKILQTALNAALMLMLKEQCYTATRAALSGQATGRGASKATNLLK